MFRFGFQSNTVIQTGGDVFQDAHDVLPMVDDLPALNDNLYVPPEFAQRVGIAVSGQRVSAEVKQYRYRQNVSGSRNDIRVAKG